MHQHTGDLKQNEGAYDEAIQLYLVGGFAGRAADLVLAKVRARCQSHFDHAKALVCEFWLNIVPGLLESAVNVTFGTHVGSGQRLNTA